MLHFKAWPWWHSMMQIKFKSESSRLLHLIMDVPIKHSTFQWNVPLLPFCALYKGPGDAPYAWKGINVPIHFFTMTPACFLTYFPFIWNIFNLDYRWNMLFYINLLKITSSFFPIQKVNKWIKVIRLVPWIGTFNYFQSYFHLWKLVINFLWTSFIKTNKTLSLTRRSTKHRVKS